jgi:hypothetical protein
VASGPYFHPADAYSFSEFPRKNIERWFARVDSCIMLSSSLVLFEALDALLGKRIPNGSWRPKFWAFWAGWVFGRDTRRCPPEKIHCGPSRENLDRNAIARNLLRNEAHVNSSGIGRYTLSVPWRHLSPFLNTAPNRNKMILPASRGVILARAS